jgi:hypothetical protein
MSIENNIKIGKLQCTFPKLTETNQEFMLGLAEGLKFAQYNSKEKKEVKMPDVTETKSAFYTRSFERKTCS